jgi:hypothetical protein
VNNENISMQIWSQDGYAASIQVSAICFLLSMNCIALLYSPSINVVLQLWFHNIVYL